MSRNNNDRGRSQLSVRPVHPPLYPLDDPHTPFLCKRPTATCRLLPSKSAHHHSSRTILDNRLILSSYNHHPPLPPGLLPIPVELRHVPFCLHVRFRTEALPSTHPRRCPQRVHPQQASSPRTPLLEQTRDGRLHNR